MRKIVVVAILCFLLCMAACAERNVESVKKPDAKSTEMQVHGGETVKNSEPVSLSGIVKNQSLPAYPAMTVGKAFDSYSHLTKKQWKETRGANGTVYIDFSGWLDGKTLGVEVKFVIDREGVFFVGMASKLEAMTDGRVFAYPLPDVKAILDSIYANKEIVL